MIIINTNTKNTNAPNEEMYEWDYIILFIFSIEICLDQCFSSGVHVPVVARLESLGGKEIICNFYY